MLLLPYALRSAYVAGREHPEDIQNKIYFFKKITLTATVSEADDVPPGLTYMEKRTACRPAAWSVALLDLSV